MWAVCGFALTGDMKADSNEKVQRTETHYRARLEGSAIFHHRWVFDVPPAYQARFAFPELKIQLRSQKKEDEREKKAQDEWDAASPDVRKTLPDLSNGGKLPQLDSATALAEGTLALHDLFTAADTNYKLKRDNTRLGEEKPLRLQMRASISDAPNMQLEDDKTIMLLTLELACGTVGKEKDRVNELEYGPVKTGMKTTSRDPNNREHFQRPACSNSPPCNYL